MAASYEAELDGVPPRWVRALLTGGEPVAFIVVDPSRHMEHPGGELPFAFIRDVATRGDRRSEGHFRFLMEDTLAALQTGGIPLVLTHGRRELYRRFGFDVFTYHCGLFVRPEQIEGSLRGVARCGASGRDLLTVAQGGHYHDDLLVVSEVRATTAIDSQAALCTAASLARQRGKARILFEHPSAPSYGSRYPVHATLVTPFTQVALRCGAELRMLAADPDSGPITDADWILALSAGELLRRAVAGRVKDGLLPQAAVAFSGNAGCATLRAVGDVATVHAEVLAGAAVLAWPAAAIAQLVTGFGGAAPLCAAYGTPLDESGLELLNRLFPPRWRLSRNENWVYPQ